MPVALAAELALQIDTRQLVVGQSIPVKLQVINGRVQGAPKLPVSEGLLAQYQGSSQQHVIVNFESTRITEYTYQLAATREGNWTVGPVNLVVDGEPLTADAVTIAVGKPPAAQGGEPVVASVTSETPYVGQVVVYRFQFKYDKPLINARWGRPDFPGFVEEVNTEATQREFQMMEAGKPYTVQTIEVPLVASGTGPQVISPAALTAQFRETRSRKRRRSRHRSIDDLFGDSPFGLSGTTETLTLATKAVEVDILPLPMDGQPADFSGLVGQFKASMRVKEKTVKLGESVTVEVVLAGDGTLAGYSLPPANDDAGYRIYDDEPTVVTTLVDGRFQSRMSLRRAVVPETVGVLDIPSLEIQTFNPVTAEYERVSTAPIRLQVLEGEEGGGVVESFVGEHTDNRTAVESTGEDILPVVRTSGVSDRTVMGRLAALVVFPIIPAVGWLLLGGVSLARGRRVDARAVLRKQMKSLPKGSDERLVALEHCFREACAIRLGTTATAVTYEGIEGLGEEYTELYRDLEAARYGGSEVDSIESRVKRIVGAL
jgi:hypothetical protein